MRAAGFVAFAFALSACGRLGISSLAGDAGTPADAPMDVPPDVLPTTGRHWVNRQLAAPGVLQGARMVFVRSRGTLVLYGGDQAIMTGRTDPSDAMWEYDGAAWTSLCDPCMPGPLFTPAMAYDTDRDRIVLYGGLNDEGGAGGLWEWHDGAWTPIATPTGELSPGPRHHSQMAYDPRRKRMVLFGGAEVIVSVAQNSGFDPRVFEYDGARWVEPTPALGPVQLGGAGQSAMWNPVTARIEILEDHGSDGDTDIAWSWDGASWVKVCDGCTGRARIDASMVFDPSPPRTFVMGGYIVAENTEIAGTWVRDVGGSRLDSVLPAKRDSVAVAYDERRDVFVLYGGNGAACRGNCAETWELVRD